MTDDELNTHVEALKALAKRTSLSLEQDEQLMSLCREYLKMHHCLTTIYAQAPDDRVVNIFYCKKPPCI
jgi:hypothetical protein